MCWEHPAESVGYPGGRAIWWKGVTMRLRGWWGYLKLHNMAEGCSLTCSPSPKKIKILQEPCFLISLFLWSSGFSDLSCFSETHTEYTADSLELKATCHSIMDHPYIHTYIIPVVDPCCHHCETYLRHPTSKKAEKGCIKSHVKPSFFSSRP